MTLILDRTPAARSGFAVLVGRAADAVVGFAAAAARVVAAEVDRRRTMRLLECDDHVLRDIGLSRSDVVSALLTPAGEKASDRLSEARDTRRGFERAQAREARRATRSS